MAIYNGFKSVRKLSNSSLTSIIDVTNLNFKSLANANLEFLNNISYDEVNNSFSVNSGNFETINVSNEFKILLDGIATVTINTSGEIDGQKIRTKVSETTRARFTDFPDFPDNGVPGEIIYTGIQNNRPEFGEDFIGYLDGRGWVSLTTNDAFSYITLTELTGSPPVPSPPNANQGIIWIGPPGYETATVPTTQTVYFTDENGDIFNMLFILSSKYLATDFVAQTSITVTHSFGRYPIVQVLDNTKSVIIPLSIVHSTVNVFVVTLSIPTTGKIIATA
jgi:hypothetical protein